VDPFTTSKPRHYELQPPRHRGEERRWEGSGEAPPGWRRRGRGREGERVRPQPPPLVSGWETQSEREGKITRAYLSFGTKVNTVRAG